MGKVIARTKIKRDKNFLYYCGTDEEGNITICKAEFMRGRRKKNEKQDM